MKKTILLISNHFPFSPGEEFLKSEVGIISNYFDVIIAPMDLRGNRITQLPSSVKVDESLAKRISKLSNSRAMRVSRGLTRIRAEAFKGVLKKPFSLANFAEIINYLAIADEIVSWFENRYKGRRNIDILYSYWFLYASYAISRIKEKYSKIICISRAHGSDLYDYVSNRPLPLRGYMLSRIDKVFCISNDGMEYLSNLFPKYSGKVTVSRLGTYDPKHLNEGSNDGSFRIVSCSSLTPVKRVDLIIKAISYVSTKIDKRIIWTHIGDGVERVKLETLACSWLNRENITYEFLGYLEHDKVLDYYSSNPVDVFINVSSSEGIPVSIMEAISFGIPVIATNVGGTSEIVDNNNGFIFEKNVPFEEIGELLFRFINEGQQRIALRRKNARRKWESFFNAERNFKEFAVELASMSPQNK